MPEKQFILTKAFKILRFREERGRGKLRCRDALVYKGLISLMYEMH
jgi:hypothetical protein